MKVLGTIIEEIRSGLFRPDETHSNRYHSEYDPFTLQAIVESQIAKRQRQDQRSRNDFKKAVQATPVEVRQEVSKALSRNTMDKRLTRCDISSEESDYGTAPIEETEDLPEAAFHSLDQWHLLTQPKFERGDRIFKCIIEKGTKIIHKSTPAFEHGAQPLPACTTNKNMWSRSATNRFLPEVLNLPITCPKCKEKQQQDEQDSE